MLRNNISLLIRYKIRTLISEADYCWQVGQADYYRQLEFRLANQSREPSQ